MVVLKKILTVQLKAASMIEVLVAMVLISIIFSLAVTVHLNVMSSGHSMPKFKAYMLMDNIAIETKENKLYFDSKLEKEGLLIEKEVMPYKSSENLLILHIKAYGRDHKVIAERKEIIAKQ